MKKSRRKKPAGHKYTNLLLVGLGIIIAVFLSRSGAFHDFLLHLNGYGYLGAFAAGILFVSTFTAATGALILLILAEKFAPLELGLIAGLGAVAGDLTIFHLVKDGLLAEVSDVYNRLGGRKLTHILHLKAFRWTLPVIGAVIIASPLPDELGVALMGISKMSPVRFAILSYVLNAAGIFLVISASIFIKP